MVKNTFRIAVLLVLVLAAGDLFSTEPSAPSPESPRLRSLKAALDSSVSGAETAFWSELSAKGTPLVEPIEGQPGKARVTFVWKGTAAGTRSVQLLSGPQITSHYEHLNFAHLSKSDVWFLTLDMPKGWRVGYMLAENAGPEGFPNGVVCDPLNPRRSVQEAPAPESGTPVYSILENPGAPAEPWLRRHAGVPSGKVELCKVQSKVLGTERAVDVYVPHGYANSEGPLGSLYLFDGEEYLRDMSAAAVLDNLIGEHQIAPMVVILIHAAPGEERDRELSCDARFTQFLTTELVPWVRSHYRVSEDPRRTIIGGVSLGGLEGAFAASEHPEIFGAVLAQSASFWWRPSGAAQADSKPWMAQKFTRTAKLPVRFFLSVGRDELVPSGANGLVDMHAMRDALLAHGYEVKYLEIEGQHDPLNWRLTLPEALMALAPSAFSGNSGGK